MGCTGKHTKKVEDTTAEILSTLTQAQNASNRYRYTLGELKSNCLPNCTKLSPDCEEWYLHPRYVSAASPFIDDNKRKYMINSFNDIFI